MSALYSSAGMTPGVGMTPSAGGVYGSGGYGAGAGYRRRWRPRVPRTFTDPIAYGHAVGRIRVLEGRFLSRQRIERLIEAETPAEQARILAETEFGRVLERLETVEDVERGLEEHLANVYRFIDESCPRVWLRQFFRLRYDFHNLRVYLKEAAKQSSPEQGAANGLAAKQGAPSPAAAGRQAAGKQAAPEYIWRTLGLVPSEAVEDAVLKEEWTTLPEPLRTAAEEAWWRFEETGDVIGIDQALDAAYFAARLGIVRAQRNGFLVRLVETEIDLANLKAFLRGRRLEWDVEQFRPALVEGGTLSTTALAEVYVQPLDALSGLTEGTAYEEPVAQAVRSDRPDLELLDKAAADITAGLIEQGRRVAVGPEPVVAYVWNREQEAAALRIVLAGKLARIPAKRLEERVRSYYGWATSGWQ